MAAPFASGMAVTRREAPEPQPVVVVRTNAEASAERPPDDDLASFEDVKGALYRRKDFLSTDEAAKSHPNRAYYYRKTQDVERLLQVCSAKLAQDPANTRALFIRASAYAKKGDVQAAAADYTRILQRDATNEDALFQRGTLYEKAGSLDDAIADFTAVLELNRGHKKAALQRAACQNLKGNLGNLELAITDYELALQGDDSKAGFAVGGRGGGRGGNAPKWASSQATRGTDSARDPQKSSAVPPTTSGSDLARSDSGTSDTSLLQISRNGSESSKTPLREPSRNGSAASISSFAGVLPEQSRSRSPSPPITELSDERVDFPSSTQGRVGEGGPASPSRTEPSPPRVSSRGKEAKEHKSTSKKAGQAVSGGGAVEAHEGDGTSTSGAGTSEAEQRGRDGAGPSAQPNTADYYHARGFAHRKSGNFKAAIEDYSKAIELDARHFKALFNRGFSYDKVRHTLSLPSATRKKAAALRGSRNKGRNFH